MPLYFKYRKLECLRINIIRMNKLESIGWLIYFLTLCTFNQKTHDIIFFNNFQIIKNYFDFLRLEQKTQSTQNLTAIRNIIKNDFKVRV